MLSNHHRKKVGGKKKWSEKEVKDWLGMKQQTEDWISRDVDSKLF